MINPWLTARPPVRIAAIPSRRRPLWTVLILALLFVSAGCAANPPGVKKSPLPSSQAEAAHDQMPPTAVEPTPAAKAGSPPASASRSTPPADARLADLASQLEALRTRLQALEGRLAEQEYQLNQWRQAGSPQQTQLQDRITTLERSLAAAQDRLARLESARSAPAPPAEPAPPPTVREVPPPPAAKPASDPWQEGLSLYKQKSYSPAREKLQLYLKDHPRGEKAVEARYYLADCLMQEKKYDEAIVEFNKVVEGAPKSTFAPPALLKQAQAFKAQGKTKIANLVLDKLLADYPKSPEAAQARKLRGKTP